MICTSAAAQEYGLLSLIETNEERTRWVLAEAVSRFILLCQPDVGSLEAGDIYQ